MVLWPGCVGRLIEEVAEMNRKENACDKQQDEWMERNVHVDEWLDEEG
jgi:hypothetical protein